MVGQVAQIVQEDNIKTKVKPTGANLVQQDNIKTKVKPTGANHVQTLVLVGTFFNLLQQNQRMKGQTHVTVVQQDSFNNPIHIKLKFVKVVQLENIKTNNTPTGAKLVQQDNIEARLVGQVAATVQTVVLVGNIFNLVLKNQRQIQIHVMHVNQDFIKIQNLIQQPLVSLVP